jgi:hypothetical protein
MRMKRAIGLTNPHLTNSVYGPPFFPGRLTASNSLAYYDYEAFALTLFIFHSISLTRLLFSRSPVNAHPTPNLHLPIVAHSLPRQTFEITPKQFGISIALSRPAIKMPSLIDLSAELKIMIVQSLDLPDLPARTGDDDFYTTIPFFRITSQDIINLGCCCKILREITATKLYSRLRLRNSDKSGQSILAVADSPWAHLVRELHFEGVTTVDAAPSDQNFPASVRKVLSDLKLFPKLDALSVRFMFGKHVKKTSLRPWKIGTFVPPMTSCSTMALDSDIRKKTAADGGP